MFTFKDKHKHFLSQYFMGEGALWTDEFEAMMKDFLMSNMEFVTLLLNLNIQQIFREP